MGSRCRSCVCDDAKIQGRCQDRGLPTGNALSCWGGTVRATRVLSTTGTTLVSAPEASRLGEAEPSRASSRHRA
jgi:hypothetical protein